MILKGASGAVTSINTFKIHETFDHYVRLEHEFFAKPISVDQNGENADGASSNRGCLFEVHLAVSISNKESSHLFF